MPGNRWRDGDVCTGVGRPVSCRSWPATAVFNTGTGNSERYWSRYWSGSYLHATTPPGTFCFDRRINGMRPAPLGKLWRPRYFHGGIASHGSPSSPGDPASHGCARLGNRAIDDIWWKRLAPIGRTVEVY